MKTIKFENGIKHESMTLNPDDEYMIVHKNTRVETLDEILRNLQKDPEHYNHGASSNGKEQEHERFDRDD